MALTLSTADSALKEDYQPAIREQLNNTVMFLQQIERNSKDVEGRRAVLSLHVGRNAGVGARADGGALPTAGQQAYAEERVPLRFNYGRIQISGPTIRAMKSDKGSFTRAVDSETKGMSNDLRRDVNRQLFGTSDGVIAATGVTAASTTVVLNTTTAPATAVQRRQLEVGMFIDIGAVATPTSVASNRQILSVTTTTITISGAAVTTATTDRIFRAGSGGSGANQKELTGIQTIVDDTGTLFNVDPTVNPTWVAVDNGNGGVNRTPTENLFAQVMHAVSIAGGADVNLWVTSDGVHRAYANNLTSLKRFPNTLDLKGGYKALSMTAGGGELGLIWDRDAPANTAFALNTEHLTQHEMSDWEWMDEDGAVLSRVSGVDAYEAVMFKYHELTTDKRNAHGVLRDLSEA